MCHFMGSQLSYSGRGSFLGKQSLKIRVASSVFITQDARRNTFDPDFRLT